MMVPNASLGAAIVSMPQIDVDIFEPQGIRKLDVEASFLPKKLAAQLIKKSFSGKKVRQMAETSQPNSTRQGLQAALRERERRTHHF